MVDIGTMKHEELFIDFEAESLQFRRLLNNVWTGITRIFGLQDLNVEDVLKFDNPETIKYLNRDYVDCWITGCNCG